MVKLENDQFLNELNRMFERSKSKGSVSLSMKRTNMKSRRSKQMKETEADVSAEEYVCLVRASDGKKKASTAVHAKDYFKFQGSYSTILKAHMDGLKKKEKVKTAKPTKPKAS
jgi:signal recognition particle subunit SRP14